MTRKWFWWWTDGMSRAWIMKRRKYLSRTSTLEAPPKKFYSPGTALSLHGFPLLMIDWWVCNTQERSDERLERPGSLLLLTCTGIDRHSRVSTGPLQPAYGRLRSASPVCNLQISLIEHYFRTLSYSVAQGEEEEEESITYHVEDEMVCILSLFI